MFAEAETASLKSSCQEQRRKIERGAAGVRGVVRATGTAGRGAAEMRGKAAKGRGPEREADLL